MSDARVDRNSGYLAPPLNFFGIWGRCPECRRWRALPYVKHFVGLKRPRWGVCQDCAEVIPGWDTVICPACGKEWKDEKPPCAHLDLEQEWPDE